GRRPRPPGRPAGRGGAPPTGGGGGGGGAAPPPPPPPLPTRHWGHEPSPSQPLAALEAAQRLRLALERLDEDEREIILLRHFEYQSNREIAWLLGIGESAANKRYIRALGRLRGLLLNLGLSGT